MTAYQPKARCVAWMGAPACALLTLPFVTLIDETSWGDLHLAYGDWQAVLTSLGLTAFSMVLMVGLGLPLAFWLARTASPLRAWVQGLVLIALLTPPLAMGILLVSTFGPYTTVGEMLTHIGVSLSNNAGAFVLAQLYGGLAYFVLSATSAFTGVPGALEEAARSLGLHALGGFLSSDVANRAPSIGDRACNCLGPGDWRVRYRDGLCLLSAGHSSQTLRELAE